MLVNDYIDELELDSDEFAQKLYKLIQMMIKKENKNLSYDYKIPAIISSYPMKVGNILICSVDLPDGKGGYIRTSNVRVSNGLIVDIGDYVYVTAINGDPKQLTIVENTTAKNGTIPLFSYTQNGVNQLGRLYFKWDSSTSKLYCSIDNSNWTILN